MKYYYYYYYTNIITMVIQRHNAVAVLGTFTHTTPEDEMWPFQHFF